MSIVCFVDICADACAASFQLIRQRIVSFDTIRLILIFKLQILLIYRQVCFLPWQSPLSEELYHECIHFSMKSRRTR